MEEKKNNEDKRDQARLSKSFIEEVKSFANTEGKQMVGFMRNKFREAMDEEEKKEVINEANKIYDVDEVIPSIYLATELSRTKF